MLLGPAATNPAQSASLKHSVERPSTMVEELERTFRPHLDILMQRTAEALAAADCDTILIHSGAPRLQFLDDQAYFFKTNPHFKSWLPLTAHPHCWVMFTPGDRPLLVYYQPDDYWHVTPGEPEGYWVDQFDLITIKEPDQVARHLPRDKDRIAVIAEDEALARSLGFSHINDSRLLNHLHFYRAKKTPYEVWNLRFAQIRAVRGHRAAERALREGRNEHEIHLAYLANTGHTEAELPYQNIIALNDHGAILHYQKLSRITPTRIHSLLIDAGGSYQGYCADITRTYAATHDDFQAVINAMDEAQRSIVDRARAGVSFVDLHQASHRVIAEVMKVFKLIRCDPEGAVERGITRAFFPHGLGHLLGLQVHDVGGHMADPQGSQNPRPELDPHLRLTRTLEPGMVVTIEPGLYFIDELLRGLRREEGTDHDVDWTRVREMRKYGGIRIEDNVLITDGEPENLTRKAFSDAIANNA